MGSTQKDSRAGLFIALTFSVSWGMAAGFYFLGGTWYTLPATLLGMAYMFVPMAMAIIVLKFTSREPIRYALGISLRPNRWFLVAWLFPPIAAFAALGISLLLPGIEYDSSMEGMFEQFKTVLPPGRIEKMKQQADTLPIHPMWLGLVMGLLAGVTVNAVAAFGEEAGWRGFLQRQWRHMGFWKSSVLIGAVWGIWHAPLILQGHNYPQHPVTGVVMMTGFCVLLAPILSYIRLRSGSVIAAAIAHGTLNGTAALSVITIRGGNDLLVGLTGASGFIVLALANLTLLLHDRFPASERIAEWPVRT